jgi:hypothetical protein
MPASTCRAINSEAHFALDAQFSTFFNQFPKPLGMLLSLARRIQDFTDLAAAFAPICFGLPRLLNSVAWRSEFLWAIGDKPAWVPLIEAVAAVVWNAPQLGHYRGSRALWRMCKRIPEQWLCSCWICRPMRPSTYTPRLIACRSLLHCNSPYANEARCFISQ